MGAPGRPAEGGDGEGGSGVPQHMCLKTFAMTHLSFWGPQLVRCGPATVAPAAPAPRPSLLSQFITCSSGQWPRLCSKPFQIPASLAGVRAVGLGFWALPPGDIAHMILSPGRGVYVVFHVWGSVTMAVLACAGPSWLHILGFVVPRVMEGSRCERSGVSRFGCFIPGGGGGACYDASPPPHAMFWFRQQKCRNTGLLCSEKRVLLRGAYHRTHVADMTQPYPFMTAKGCSTGQHTPQNTRARGITGTPTLCHPY